MHPHCCGHHRSLLYHVYIYVVVIMMIISKLTNESIQKIDSLFRRRTRINLLAIIAILLLGSVALSNLEGYSFVTSLYLAVQTITVSGVEQYSTVCVYVHDAIHGLDCKQSIHGSYSYTVEYS